MVTNKATSVIAAAGIIGGYAAWRVTKVRWLGSLVMTSAGAAAGRRWMKDDPLAATGLGLLYSGAFAATRPLAKRIGSVPAAVSMAALAAGAAWYFHDREADEADVAPAPSLVVTAP